MRVASSASPVARNLRAPCWPPSVPIRRQKRRRVPSRVSGYKYAGSTSERAMNGQASRNQASHAWASQRPGGQGAREPGSKGAGSKGAREQGSQRAGHPQGVALLYTKPVHKLCELSVYSRATPCGWPARWRLVPLRVACSLAAGCPLAPWRLACSLAGGLLAGGWSPCGWPDCGWPARWRLACPRVAGLIAAGLLAGGWPDLLLSVTLHILFDVELSGLRGEFVRGLIHRQTLVLVEDAYVLLLRFHCQHHRLCPVMRVMIGGDGGDRGVPGIERVIERRAGTKDVDEGEAVMVDALLDQGRQFFWPGGIAASHEADVERKRRCDGIELRSHQAVGR